MSPPGPEVHLGAWGGLGSPPHRLPVTGSDPVGLLAASQAHICRTHPCMCLCGRSPGGGGPRTVLQPGLQAGIWTYLVPNDWGMSLP